MVVRWVRLRRHERRDHASRTEPERTAEWVKGEKL